MLHLWECFTGISGGCVWPLIGQSRFMRDHHDHYISLVFVVFVHFPHVRYGMGLTISNLPRIYGQLTRPFYEFVVLSVLGHSA